MAIIPETQYPGKITPASSDYPYGQARNITLPGDGTGTPWEAALVNDLFGFQQALLEEAGITPTGDPETATDSQYLEALRGIFQAVGTLEKDVGGSVNVELTAKEAASRILVFTGALTADIAVILPDDKRLWLVVNNTTGAFDLTVRTNAGSGPVVPQGVTYGVRGDGTDTVKYQGTAAELDHGTTAGDAVRLEDVDGVPGLPAVDGSQLINLAIGEASGGVDITGLEIRTSPDRGLDVLEIFKGVAIAEDGTALLRLSGGGFIDAAVTGEGGIYEGNREADTFYAIYLLAKTGGALVVMAVHQDTPVWDFSGSYEAIRLIAWARLDSGAPASWAAVSSYEEGEDLVVVPEENIASGPLRLVDNAIPADASWFRVPAYAVMSPAIKSFRLGASVRQAELGGRITLRTRPIGSARVDPDTTSIVHFNSGPASNISNPQTVDVIFQQGNQADFSVLQGVRTFEWQSRFGAEATAVFLDLMQYKDSRKIPTTWDRYKRDDYPFKDSQFVRLFREAGVWYLYGFKFTGAGSATTNDVHLWTSSDGINWTESPSSPVLTTGGAGAWDENRVWSLTVTKVGAGDYRALYTGRDASINNAIGYATASSPEGPWTKFAGNPVITPVAAWEGNDIEIGSITEDAGTIYAWYHQVSDVPRQSGLATSTDWETWTKDAANPIFTGSATDEVIESQQFSPGVFKYDGYFYNVLSGYNGNTKGSTDGAMFLYRDVAPTFYADERERIGVIGTATQKWEQGGSRAVFDTFRVVIDGDSAEVAAPYVANGRMWCPYAAYDGEVDNGRWAVGMMNVPVTEFASNA